MYAAPKTRIQNFVFRNNCHLGIFASLVVSPIVKFAVSLLYGGKLLE